MSLRTQIDNLMKATEKAYSRQFYSDAEWEKIAGWLLVMHDPRKALSVLFSKHMRWCRDELKAGLEPTALDFIDYVDRHPTSFNRFALEQLVREISGESA